MKSLVDSDHCICVFFPREYYRCLGLDTLVLDVRAWESIGRCDVGSMASQFVQI